MLSGAKRRNCVIQADNVADVCPKPPISGTLHDLSELSAICLDNKVDHLYTGRRSPEWSRYAHKGASGPDQACGTLRNIAAEYIEHQVDLADVFQLIVFEVDELMSAGIKRGLTVRGPSSAYHISSRLTPELACHRTDYARRAVDEDALSRLEATVPK